MIQPVNKHILVNPLKAEGFIQRDDNKFEQIGVVVALPMEGMGVAVGDRVYFDSWTAGKYRNPDGGPDDFYWLVSWEDVKAVEKAESLNAKNEVSE